MLVDYLVISVNTLKPNNVRRLLVVVKCDINKIMSCIFPSILASFRSTYFLVYII